MDTTIIFTQATKKTLTKRDSFPLNPGSRPTPITFNDDGNVFRENGTSASASFIDVGEDDRIDFIKDNEPMTSPKKRSSFETSPCDQADGDTDSRTTENKCCPIRVKGGYNPVLFFSLAYFGAAFMFLLTINLFMLPDLYYPTIGNLLPVEILHDDTRRVLMLIVFWGMHYVRRFGEVLLVHIYNRGIPLYEVIGSIIYYSFFGFWIGWSINYHIGYRTPPNSIFVPGLFISFIGGMGNFMCHLQLRIMRKSKRRRNTVKEHPRTKHVIPYGGCFELVSCPHYLFEIVIWLGFAIAAFTLAAWTFCIAVISTLVFYARKKHLALKREFNGRDDIPMYPKKKKALIPFIY